MIEILSNVVGWVLLLMGAIIIGLAIIADKKD